MKRFPMLSAEATRLERFQYRVELAELCLDTTKWGVRKWREHRARRLQSQMFYITVDEDEDLYDAVVELLVKTVEREDQRALSVGSTQTYDRENDAHVHKLVLDYDGNFATTLRVDGHDVNVSISKSQVNATNGDTAQSDPTWNESLLALFSGTKADLAETTSEQQPQTTLMQLQLSKHIIFECVTIDARDAVLQLLDDLIQKFNDTKRNPRFYVADSHGNWRYRAPVELRPLDTVILGDGQMDGVIGDLRKFMESEIRYRDLGLPWHRGFLFYGPPGTGKTSLARALATEFGLDLYFIPLSSVESDSKLLDLFAGLDGTKGSSRAMLIIEDIDIASAARERDDERHGVTLNGLLNALDGVATPHGLITVMTTNAREVLDDALVRPGRVDFQMEVGYVTDEQLHKMVTRFYGRSLKLPLVTQKVSPAQIVGLFKEDLSEDDLLARLAAIVSSGERVLL